MSNPTDSPVTAPRPRRRRLRWSLVLLLIFIAPPAGYYFYATWSLQSELAEVIAETDRLDPRWRLEDIEADRKTFRDEENAALQVILASRLILNRPTEHLNHGQVFFDVQAQTQLNSQQIDIIREALQKMPAALIEARKLKDMPGGRFPITFSENWISTPLHQTDCHRLFNVLRHDALLRVQQGDPDAALESCRALLNAARALGDEPRLASQQLRLAGDQELLPTVERCLAQGYPGAEAMKSLQDSLSSERTDAKSNFIHALRGQRAGYYRLYLLATQGKIEWNAFTPRGIPKTSFGVWFRDKVPLLNARDYPRHLRHMNELVSTAKLPLDQQLNRFHELQPVDLGGADFSFGWLSSMDKTCEYNVRIQAGLAYAESGLACERFRIAHERWPESLAELVKAKLLDAAPTDPYDGQPLRLVKRKDGITVYSVGKDKEDNGGNIDPNGESGPGTDLGFRLWDPKHRRQPPRPPVALGR